MADESASVLNDTGLYMDVMLQSYENAGSPRVPDDVAELAERVGADPRTWWHQCHRASLQIVRAGIFPEARVARGTAVGVGGQHSWVVLPPENGGLWMLSQEGSYAYHPDATIFDPTLWSYDVGQQHIVEGRNLESHRPHGWGSIWDWGQPVAGLGKPIKLKGPWLNDAAKAFLEMIEPLDRQGWGNLFTNAPVGGWPSKSIYMAAAHDERLAALIPIDRLGMVTDLNPEGLYMKEIA